MKLLDENQIPTVKEKEESIAYIMSQVSNQPKTFTQFIYVMFKEMDWRVCFWGLKDILLVSFSFILAILIGTYYGIQSDNFFVFLLDHSIEKNTYFYVFLLSPVVYGLFHYLSLWKEVQMKTFELKMTLKISLREIQVIRSLVFSVIALVVSVCLSLICWLGTNQEFSLLKLISIASVSLFLYLIIQIKLDQKLSIRWNHVVSPIFWSVVGVVLMYLQDVLVDVILQLPELVVFLLGIVLMGSYFLMLRQNYMSKREGGLSYVGIEER